MPRGTPPLYTKCRPHNRRGEPCGRWALRGASVCVTHGAAAPQVRQRAAERLALLVPDALGTLKRLLEPGVDEHLQLAAAREVLRLGAYVAATESDAGGSECRSEDELSRREINGLVARARQVHLATPGEDAERYAV